MNENATIFVIDDDPAVRDALTMLLEQENFTVEAFDSAESFLRTCRLVPRSCAIIDIRMAEMDGLQLQVELSKRGILLPIIFLTGHGNIPMSVQAIKAGAIDFLTKPITGIRLLASVATALHESEKLHLQGKANQKATECIACLTDREREVMTHVIAGLPNKEIARILGISHRTIEIHKARIMHKTSANTLLDLVQIAKACRLCD